MSEPTYSRREMLRGRMFQGLAQAVSAVVASRVEALLPEEPPRPVPRSGVAPAPVSDPTPPPGAEQEPKMKLPDLQQSFLDEQTLSDLFRDIQVCTQVIEVIPKFAARGYAPEAGVDIEQGRQLLVSGRARALQIRYVYEGAQWWDTLINTPSGVRVVRIRHDVGQPGQPAEG